MRVVARVMRFLLPALAGGAGGHDATSVNIDAKPDMHLRVVKAGTTRSYYPHYPRFRVMQPVRVMRVSEARCAV